MQTSLLLNMKSLQFSIIIIFLFLKTTIAFIILCPFQGEYSDADADHFTYCDQSLFGCPLCLLFSCSETSM